MVGTNLLELLMRGLESTNGVEIKCYYTLFLKENGMALIKAKASPYVITDVKGRRLWIANRIRYPGSQSRK